MDLSQPWPWAYDQSKGLQGCGPRRKPRGHISCSRECKRIQKSVREWTLTLPSELPFWELESQWTPKSLEGKSKGQNPLDWRVLYIIGNLLKHRCLKWARMTRLDIWNTNYSKKKGLELNWQFDSWPLKVKNRPDFLVCRWHATYC